MTSSGIMVASDRTDIITPQRALSAVLNLLIKWRGNFPVKLSNDRCGYISPSDSQCLGIMMSN